MSVVLPSALGKVTRSCAYDGSAKAANIMACPLIVAAASIALSRRILLPPCCRRLERSSPQAAPRVAGFPLRLSIAAATMACIVERVAGAHHGFAEIDAVDGAERDVAVVLVDLDWFAGDAAAADRGRKRAHRRAPAGIGLAVGVAAVLLAVRRVDAVQADAYAGDFERIPVDHARRTGDRLARRTWWPLQNVRNRRQHGEDQQPDHDGRRAAQD